MRIHLHAMLLGMIAVLLVLHGPAHAQQSTFVPKAKHAILMDADSGAVLFQHEADELTPPASMSKLMTLAVVFKALKNGVLKPTDEITMSEHAWRTGGAPSGTSAMFVPINDKVTVDELLQGIIVQSGNDACIAIAEALAGTEEGFAQVMTNEARRIGLKKSTFRNSTGLYHPEHMMTMHELADLARYIMTEYADRFPLFAQKEFKYRKHRFFNRNPLLFLDIGADGMKTGYIKEAGYGIVGTAVQEGKRLIVVVNGLESSNDRRDEARRLLEWGFRSFGPFDLFKPGEVVGSARVWGGSSFYVPLVGKNGVTVVLPRYPANQRLSAEILYKGPLKPPIRKGDQVARLRVSSSTSAVSEVPLYAAEDVDKAGILRQGLDSLIHLGFKWIKIKL
ncbi:MAG: D-alanyl-D-alanine carboxypeptidase [Hyphomicrobiaceae bacterium]|nr:D-alanyl-D-alanine carboxypeptidase [Hyphomicrobiaceae bacterium]